MADPPQAEKPQEPYNVNDVDTTKNAMARRQYYGDNMNTSTGRHMSQ